MPPSVLVVAEREPTPRRRMAENRPEERRALILERLTAAGCRVDAVAPDGDAALTKCVALGVASFEKLDLIRGVHAHFRADAQPDASFFSPETANPCDGLVPYFFVKGTPATQADPVCYHLLPSPLLPPPLLPLTPPIASSSHCLLPGPYLAHVSLSS